MLASDSSCIWLHNQIISGSHPQGRLSLSLSSLSGVKGYYRGRYRVGRISELGPAVKDVIESEHIAKNNTEKEHL